MLVVLDTNIIVSALWSRNGEPAKIMALALHGFIKPCYDQRIFTDYKEVLKRPKFNFTAWEIAGLLSQIEHQGCSVVAEPLRLSFIDEDDLKFFEVARHCKAGLITGNLRHYPDDPIVMSVANFLSMYFGDNADGNSGQDTTPTPKGQTEE